MLHSIDYLVEFAGAVPATCILFLFPAWGYLRAKNRLRDLGQRDIQGDGYETLVAWFFISFAILVFTSYIFSIFFFLGEREGYSDSES